MVWGTFLHAVMPHLGASQCVEITRSFRQGIEGAMGLMDDVALSAEYHSALLELTNTILEKLGQVSGRRD